MFITNVSQGTRGTILLVRGKPNGWGREQGKGWGARPSPRGGGRESDL